ncbi:MAG TPA: DUF6263 family protein, partial [Flavipsychrobacter sp.]
MSRCFLLLVLMSIVTAAIAQNDTISINMNKGEMYALDYKMTSTTNTTLSGAQKGNSQKVFIELEGGLILSVKDVLTDGYRVQAYYNHFAMKSETPKVSFSFDTQQTDTIGIEEDELKSRRVFSAIMNHPFYLTISKTGAIEEIEGLDQLIEKITLEQHVDKPGSQSAAQIVG